MVSTQIAKITDVIDPSSSRLTTNFLFCNNL